MDVIEFEEETQSDEDYDIETAVENIELRPTVGDYVEEVEELW